MNQTLEPTYDSAKQGNFMLDELREIFNYRELILSLTLQNVTIRYKRSSLGVLWTLLDPLLTMIILSFVFTQLFARNLPAFPVFLFSGLITWNFFSKSSTQAMSDLNRAESLLGKIQLPKSVFIVSAVGGGVINLLISMIPMIGLMLIYQRPFTLALFFIPVSLTILTMITLGFGFLVSAVALFFNDIQNIYQVLLRLLFYSSGIMYAARHLPVYVQSIMDWSPFHQMVEMFRYPIYEGKVPTLFSLWYSFLFGFIILSLGFYLFAKYKELYESEN